MSNKQSQISSSAIDIKRLRFLDNLRKFFDMTTEDEQFILDCLSTSFYRKGSIIDCSNATTPMRLFIMNGVARTYYILDGKEYNYSFSFTNEFIMLPLTVTNTGVSVFVQFLRDTEVCKIAVKSMDNLSIYGSDKFHKFINVSLINHVRYMEQMMYMLRLDAKERYKWALRKYPQILEYVSITQLASFLNITKETLYSIRSGKY